MPPAGGYSELHVPFCGHAVLQTMSGSLIHAEDPMGPRMAAQQPNAGMVQVYSELISQFQEHFGV
jgi:predicted PhzF superfamily epimerase YddE/YHI9